MGVEVIRKLMSLESPYIVKYYEGFWETQHGPYFTMTEYYPV